MVFQKHFCLTGHKKKKIKPYDKKPRELFRRECNSENDQIHLNTLQSESGS